ncbi:DUF3048 domain-containing protein [Actinomadura sp. DC4]|uniref:DUF3048 domain-containing protein n=1 Tax=Actinomadura sp. DC4 TaxID=3055069 RepID=UPI0025B0F443|nr:DUF3048 domain-containing protein [Actinomadura sp. DC4]MDN3358021.1 DUF3048 domain-containing protein [Actinomadura sp. DC4]
MRCSRVAPAVTAALAGTTLVACSNPPEEAATAPPPAASEPAPTPSATPTVPAPANPFTGTDATPGPVLAVKIDNTRSAKPQLGLRSADIVYVEQVEGGLSRIMAVFSSKLPARVGPVRSARISDLHLLPQFGRPAFAYSGVQGKMKPYVAEAPLLDVSQDRSNTGYLRAGSHPAPYNLYGTPKRLLARAHGASKASDIGFRFGPAPDGGRTVKSFTARYPAASLRFRWSAKDKRWLVTQDGSPDRAAEGGRLGGQTIVIQKAHTTRSQFHDFLGNYTPLVKTVGKGKATVLRDGKAYDARWSRASEKDGTTFTTASGRPMTFAPGQVWVVLVNDGKPTTP